MKASIFLIALSFAGMAGVSSAHVTCEAALQMGRSSVLIIDLGTLSPNSNITGVNFDVLVAGLLVDMVIFEANPFGDRQDGESTEISYKDLHISTSTDLSIYAAGHSAKDILGLNP